MFLSHIGQEQAFAVQRGSAESVGAAQGERTSAPNGETQKPDEEKKKCENQGDDDARQSAKSRRLLSSATSIPDWVFDVFQIPKDEIVLSHVRHKGGVLPHIQVRMLAGDSYEGKCRGSSICAK